MKNFKKVIKEALTPHYLRESVNEAKLQRGDKITIEFDDEDGDYKAGDYTIIGGKKGGKELEGMGIKIFMTDKELNSIKYTVNEDIVDDKAKMYWLQKLKSGEIDTLPDNPRMEYLRHAMRDQLAQDKEQLSRERNDLSKSSSLIGRMGDRNLEESVNEGYLERAIEDEKDPKKTCYAKN